MVFIIPLIQKQGEHTDVVRGAGLLSFFSPFVSDLRRQCAELGVHVSCDVRKSEENPS